MNKKSFFIFDSVRVAVCALAVACAVILNLCVSLLPDSVKKVDLTFSGMFALDRTVIDTLKEKKDIEIVYIAESGEEDLLCSQMLTRVDEQCTGITLTRLDPVLYPEKAAEYDCAVGSFVVKSPLRTRVVSVYDLYEYEFEGIEGQRYSYGEYYEKKAEMPELMVTEFFVGERRLLSAIEYVSASALPMVYFTMGHGELTGSDNAFINYLDADNVTMMQLYTASLTELPEDADTIVILNPKKDFSASECLMLKSFINGGGHVVLFTEQDTEPLKNLEGLLGELGMERVDGQVYEEEEGRYVGYKWFLLPNTVECEFTEGVDAVFMPVAHGIAMSETVPEGVSVRAVLNTSEDAFSRTEDGEEDISGPFMLGADASLGEGSLTWYGSPYIAYSEFKYNGTSYMMSAPLFLNTVEKNCEISESVRELSHMTGKQTVGELLTVPESEKNAWTVLLAVLLPLGVLVYGLYRVTKRKRA